MLCIGALPAAVATALALKQFGALDAGIGQIIRYSIAGSVLLTVVALLFKGKNAGLAECPPGKNICRDAA